MASMRRPSAPVPLGPAEIEELQAALDALPASLEPLALSAIDGLICAALVQPRAVPRARWLALALDVEGRPAPKTDATARIGELLARREAELRQAIDARQWFDPWVFADEVAPSDDDDDGDDDDAESARALVAPWVDGFAIGFDAFPLLHDLGGAELPEAMAPIFRHFAPDELEDADALLVAIEEGGPALDAQDAVEGLVRGTLLLADLARDVAAR